jgi:hypothetical protein
MAWTLELSTQDFRLKLIWQLQGEIKRHGVACEAEAAKTGGWNPVWGIFQELQGLPVNAGINVLC